MMKVKVITSPKCSSSSLVKFTGIDDDGHVLSCTVWDATHLEAKIKAGRFLLVSQYRLKLSEQENTLRLDSKSKVCELLKFIKIIIW